MATFFSVFLKSLCWLLWLPASVLAISIGTVEEPPGNFIDNKGVLTGLSVDFVKAIQKRVGNTSKIQMFPPSRLIANSLNTPNFVIFSLSRTPEREDKYHWISLVMRKPLVMFALKEANLTINNLQETKKLNGIGVLHSSMQHDFLVKNGFKNIEAVYSHKQNLKKLMAGRISLMYHSVQGAAKLCKDLGIDFNVIEPVLILQISNSSIAMSKLSSIKTVKEWQAAAKALKKDGTFNTLAKKWLMYTEDVIGIPSEIKDGALNFWRESPL